MEISKSKSKDEYVGELQCEGACEGVLYHLKISDWVIVRSWCNRENNKINVVTEYGCSEQFTQVFIAVCEDFVIDICKRLNMMAAKSKSCWHYDYKELEYYNECFEEKDV